MFQNSKFMIWTAIAAALSIFTLLLLNKSYAEYYDEQCIPILWTVGALFIAFFSAVFRASVLIDRKNAAEFKANFGIDPSGIYFRECAGHPDTEATDDVQKLVNRILREKAEAFHAARMKQQGHFTGGSVANADDAAKIEELHKELQAAKRAFWSASDAARRCNFEVKEKYAEWFAGNTETKTA